MDLKETLTKPSNGQHTNELFQAFGEAHLFMNFTPITTKTARCQSFTTSSPTLNESTLHELQQSIPENGITENSPNDQMKLEMAGQIGSALLAENSCLKEKIFRLEANLF